MKNASSWTHLRFNPTESIFLILGLTGIGLLSSNLGKLSDLDRKIAVHDRNLELGRIETPHPWNANIIRLFVGNHLPSFVDGILLRFLGDDRMTLLRQGERSELGFDLLLASELDPRFLDLYLSGATILSIVRDDYVSANGLMERADEFRLNQLPKYSTKFRASHWPRASRINLQIYYLNTYDQFNVERALKALNTLRIEDDPLPILVQLKERSQSTEGIFEVGMRMMEQALRSNKHESLKELLMQKLNFLRLNYWYYQLKTKGRAHSLLTDPLGHSVQWPKDRSYPWSEEIQEKPFSFWIK